MGLVGSGGLFCGYVIYLLIGGYIFRELEHPNEVITALTPFFIIWR